MSDQSDNPYNLWEELKRRKVIRVIPVYAAAAFVLLELVDIITEPFGLPDWTLKLVIVLLAVGLVVSVILSWIYDVTPEGVQKTKPAKEILKTETTTTSKPWKIATYVSVVIIVGLIIIQIFGRSDGSFNIDNLEKTIAVLPFESYGNNDSSNFLHMVIPIAIIGELQNVEGFTVRARGSSLKYENTNMRRSDIGNELNANYLLTGIVQQQDKKVLVNIMLEQAQAEEVIWEESFEMVVNDIFKVQQDISKKVAHSLKNNFIPLAKNPTDSSEAWMSYLTGLSYYWKDEREIDFELAIKYFERAVQIDPQFSLAYAKLSSSHCMMYHFHYDRTENRLLQAKKTLERANEVDAGNPDVQFAEGVYSYVVHDFENSLEKYKAVEGLVSENEELYLMFGSLYRRKGDLKKANEYYLKSYELDPQHGILPLELGETYLMLGEYELSEKYFDIYRSLGGVSKSIVDKVYLYLLWEKNTNKSRQTLMETKALLGDVSNMELTHQHIRIELIDKHYDDAIAILNNEGIDSLDHQFIYKPKSLYYAEIYWLQNKSELANRYFDSARIHLEAKIDDSPQDHRYHSSLGIAYAGLGRKKEAIEAGIAGISLMPKEKDYYRGIFRLEDLTRIYAMVGEYDLSLKYLDQLLDMPSLISVNLLRKDPAWKPLWNLPEFKKMIEKHSD